MTGSRINPRLSYKTGQEETGGYLAANDGRKTATSPDWSGRFYLVGYGWIWLSGWMHESNGKQLIRLLGDDMTDEKAAKFCAPKAKQKTPARPGTTYQSRNNGQTSADSDEPEIPF